MEPELFSIVQRTLEEFRVEWNDLRVSDVQKNRGWDEDLRYDHVLTPEDVVWDVGAHEGEFAARIHCQYGCTVRMFEILPRLHELLTRRFTLEAFKIEGYGLGASDLDVRVDDNGDRTSLLLPDPWQEMVTIRRVSGILHEPIALMKVNIEGGEYDLIDDLIDADKIVLVKHLQVQFHHWVFMEDGALFEVPNALERYVQVTTALAQTHQRDWGIPWVWESWSLRT